MEKSRISALLKKLPGSPGVYKMKDKEGRIIYVGKAKNLSKRVRSYFRVEKNRPIRTQKLVESAVDLEWIEVSSELEALFLETNLIKELRPKYNVLMKDDKNFVYIKITKEDFPRVQIVRKVEKDGARYFGPKTAAHNVKKTLMLLQKLFLYRSCDLGLTWISARDGGRATVTKKTIAYPCLDYHIKRCQAPCISAISPEEYQKSIQQIEYFLEGKTSEIEADLKVQMSDFVAKKEFERAALLRDKLLALNELSDFKQVVTSADHQNADVFAFVLNDGKAYFNLFMLRDGKLIGQENFVADAGGFESVEVGGGEVMESFLEQYYEKAVEFPSEILVPDELLDRKAFEDYLEELSGKKVKILVPERGKKHKLIELAEKNAQSFQKQHKARWELTGEPQEAEALLGLKNALKMAKIPKRIECFDISHFGGEDTVASMVVFENGLSKSNDYRKFHLKTLVKGEIDDFKSMEEILRRRLRYLSGAPKGIMFRKVKGRFVAFKAKKEIGHLEFMPGQNKTYLQKSFFVDPAYREQGISKSLFLYSVEKLKAKRIYLSCSGKMNEFYEGFGFESIKEMPKNFAGEFDAEGNFYAYDPAKHHDSSFESKPDLIVIDGGKGQLSSALKSRNNFGLKIPMIGLAKREEEIFTEGKSAPLVLPKDSKALLLLQRIRDEAHRFAISFQRKTREKEFK